MNGTSQSRQLMPLPWPIQISRLSNIDAIPGIKTVAAAALLLAISILLFGYIQSGSEGLVGTDGYYHARMALLIRNEGLKPVFN